MSIINDTEKHAPDLRYGYETIIGARESQQDNGYYYSSPEGTIAVVCDGMGGMDDGGKASMTAIREISAAYRKKPAEEPVPEFFRKQAISINEKISGFRSAGGGMMNSGTTIVAVVAEHGKLWWLSVGDSRIYLIRGREMKQVNREHNYRMILKEQLLSGRISQEQYDAEEKTRKAEALISYLGIRNLTLMEINQNPFQLLRGDRVLLCSDGVYKSLSDDQIKALLDDNDIDLNIAAKRICSMALRYGGRGQDNTTLIVLQQMS
ncbi:MAG: protein serine/threonine phosphatase 2C family protein [Stomatobaculum sp.]|nr:protein serine/threonine phosphatase 2C family protein [Stomatobaculum sp.]